MSEMEHARGRLAAVEARKAAAAKVSGRDAGTIELIAISKTQSVDAITSLLAAGQRSYGENRVQEAQVKWPILKATYADVRLHLVGQLQSNKAAEAVELFDVIHSIDRLSLLTALAKALLDTKRRPDFYVQVNIGDEPQKGGCPVSDLPILLADASRLGVPIAGLMCIPPEGVEAAPYFALLAKLARDHHLTGLSMGMSADFETAVMLGATSVRVGTALFGARP